MGQRTPTPATVVFDPWPERTLDSARLDGTFNGIGTGVYTETSVLVSLLPAEYLPRPASACSCSW